MCGVNLVHLKMTKGILYILFMEITNDHLVKANVARNYAEIKRKNYNMILINALDINLREASITGY